jgi:hypothetical protein
MQQPHLVESISADPLESVPDGLLEAISGIRLESIPDDELLRRLAKLTQQSRRVESDLVAHIGEVDARRLYAREASPSMFAYCTDILHLSEAEAYLRIAAARASRENPILLAMLRDGRLHLTAIALLAPHLGGEKRDTLLRQATHKSKRQIQELLAEIAPRPDAPAVMRKISARREKQESPGLPLCPDRVAPSLELRPDGVAPSTSGVGLDRAAVLQPEGPGDAAAVRQPELRLAGVLAPARATVRPAVVQPLAPGRYRVQFTASAELHDKLERLRALMHSKGSDGDLAAIIEEAVTEKLERLEARRFAKTNAPRKRLSETDTSPTSRHIPAAVRRAVHERDGGRCRYVDEQGRRCSARDRLEYHHRHPFGLGGDHNPQGICLMCRAHNQYLAELDYGREAMVRHRDSGTRLGATGPGGPARREPVRRERESRVPRSEHVPRA